MDRCLYFTLLLSVAYCAEWCATGGKYLSGYTSGGKVAFPYTAAGLAQAKAKCSELGAGCGGITQEPNHGNVYSLRKGTTHYNSPSKEVSWVKGACPCWAATEGKYLSGYTSGGKVAPTDLATAQKACAVMGAGCGGITKEPNHGNVYSLRKGTTLYNSPSKEVSWLRTACPATVAEIEWCPTEDKYLSGYTMGGKVAPTDLATAQATCADMGAGCGGITKEPNHGNVYSLRKATTLKSSPSKEVSWLRGPCPEPEVPLEWCDNAGKYLSTYTSGGRRAFPNTAAGLAQAKAKCAAIGGGCGGITQEPLNSNEYTLRRGTTLKNSPSNEISWLRGACVEEVPVVVPGLLAQGKDTDQSSEGWNGDSGRAVDGTTSGNYWSHSCTHSATASNNWWSVNLGSAKAVEKVVIYNRADCCQSRIGGTKVYVGAEFCGEVVYVVGASTFTVQCNGAVGSTVKLVQNDNYLTLCEVKVYGEDAAQDAQPQENVALGKLASLSPGYGWGGKASRAIDGRVAGNYWSHSCTHSAGINSNSWQVDLKGHYAVDRVVIHGRRDCCQNRINGAKVYLDDVLCGTVEWNAAHYVYPITCSGKVGSVVKITKSGNYLTLCEVEVLAVKTDTSVYQNVAKAGKASQDSTANQGVASRAIDGDTNGQFDAGKTCTHSGSKDNAYWSLQLAEQIVVDHVILWNRQDCCGERLNGAKVYVDEFLCGTVAHIAGQQSYIISCGLDGAVGRKVTVKGAPGQFLSLCEVEVMNDPSVSVDSILYNLALKKPTSQSSEGWSGASARAVDGHISGRYWDNTCTHTTGAGWWKVDLENYYNVEQVVIFNREDCCANRLNGVKVYVGDMLCGTVTYVAGKVVYTLECPGGIVGDSVKIVNSNTYLTLCEVKVMGKNEVVVERSKKVVTGTKSEARDDAQSIGQCPSGYVVEQCEVKSRGVPSNSDGIKVFNSNKCIAYNSYKGAGATVQATCGLNEQYANPCGGESLPARLHVEGRGAQVSVSCPAGYKMVDCIFWSAWAPALTSRSAIKSDGKISYSNNVCALSAWPVSNTYNYAILTAFCSLEDTLASYAGTVCPTCTNYVCGEGEVCVMKDEGPSCELRMTGCDNNVRCGDYGSCQPVGSSDFTCNCNDGYNYDEEGKTCLKAYNNWEIVKGSKARGNDGNSIAECPDGQVVRRCHTYGVTGSSDGVTIDNHGSLCSAHCVAHAGDHPIQAIAYCGSSQVVSDACTQANISTVEYRYATGSSPSISCPPGYLMSSCVFWSMWTAEMSTAARARVDSIGSVGIVDNQCAVPQCTNDDHWCKLTAICTKLTGSEYVQAACPTCDKVACAEGFECSIGAGGLPECNEIIIGGCAVNNCGSGACVEVNVTDYMCSCPEGFDFDGTTCSDINECSVEPCGGNGQCVNTAGSYSCNCIAGFAQSSGTCVDVNECLGNPCSANERCSNIEGSYICDCLETFYREGTQCVCATGFAASNGACVDIDECENNNNPCTNRLNEVCTNSVGSYSCSCKPGFETNPSGVCTKYEVGGCGITAKNSEISSLAGNSVKVQLKGKIKPAFYVITWYKDGAKVDFSDAVDGKETLKGFTLYDFQAEDAGRYRAEIYFNKPGLERKCEVVVTMSMIEGSAVMDIANRKELGPDKKAGRSLVIKCSVKLTNVKLDAPNDPNNVDWYRVVPGEEDVKIVEDGRIEINKARGTYRLFIKPTTVADSGSYRCSFKQGNVEASTDVAINVV